MGFVFCYITISSKKEALAIARSLLQKKLIGCANVFPIDSVYQWNGVVKHGKEWVLLVKTERKLVLPLRREVERMHSYDIPCVTTISVSPNTKYASWLRAQLR